ncbi:MAG: prepilin-type N-terminal cleavage/methylation domain-containing protein [Magnetococcales bacterium]|nr:prepilin-type N-terminal cleavage/methylation domain-containing protein [Magnetococcales bacterium]
MAIQKTGSQAGFTLIEIAIVVVIIGLLLGGVLKGQEMIKSARTHNVVDQGNAIKAAVLGFSDRYRALPGDYSVATENIPGLNGENGDGNRRIGYSVKMTGTDTTLPEIDAANRGAETAYAWKHLARAGYVSGSFDGKPLANLGTTTAGDVALWSCPATTCMSNAFNGSMVLVYANEQSGRNTSSDVAMSNQLWTGANLPVEIIAEIDRKIDDGNPANGSIRVADSFLSPTSGVGDVCAANAFDANGEIITAATTAQSLKDITVPPKVWAIISQVTNCGGVYLF